ncbi:MAG: ATP-binding protein [Actinomycetia bacterium]|nr:ATP-binding protein [Actinomycetes bacterium]
MKKNINYEKNVKRDFFILGDKKRLIDLFVNLLGNAAKYSPQNSTVKVIFKENEENIEVIIKDQGPGIPESEHERIFKKFYRSKNVSPEVGGTGLGLAICKTIIDYHNGKIWVQSKPGEGSDFHLILPLFKA